VFTHSVLGMEDLRLDDRIFTSLFNEVQILGGGGYQ
jgi:hypothetical protein